MPKVAIVAVLAFVFAALALFFSLSAEPTESERKVAGERLKPSSSAEGERNLLLAIQSQLSSVEARLRALEQRPTALSSGLPSVPAALPADPPLQLPDGSDAPWAWIGKLAPDKQAAVEKAFGDAATAFRASSPEGTGLDDAKLEASMAQLEQDIARRLKSILSPQEFEDYLLSLPDDALERLGFEKSGT
jgi:hypothetical protein